MCLKCVQKASIEAMRRAAAEVGVSGACVAVAVGENEPQPWNPTVGYLDRFQREPDPAKGSNDTGASYLGVCLGKWAEMMETGAASGTIEGRAPKKGEFGYRGGVTKKVGQYTLYTAFSGGTQDQDVQIATKGLEALELGLSMLTELVALEARQARRRRGVPLFWFLGGLVAWISLTLLIASRILSPLGPLYLSAMEAGIGMQLRLGFLSFSGFLGSAFLAAVAVYAAYRLIREL